MTADHKKELPRVRRMFTKLSDSVDQYQAEKEASLTDLQNIVEEIKDVERSLDENKPTLARYEDSKDKNILGGYFWEISAFSVIFRKIFLRCLYTVAAVNVNVQLSFSE